MSHPLHFQWEFPIADDRQQERIEQVIDNLKTGLYCNAHQQKQDARELLIQLSDYLEVLNRYQPGAYSPEITLQTTPITYSYHYFSAQKKKLEGLLNM